MDEIIKNATKQALDLLRQLGEDKDSFRKLGLTFEEKAFYDILMHLRDKYNFEYGSDRKVGNVIINDKCKVLAQKIKEIIDTQSAFANWLNNANIRADLNKKIFFCLVKYGYPPQYNDDVFEQVMDQVENFKEHHPYDHVPTAYSHLQEDDLAYAAEPLIHYGNVDVILPKPKKSKSSLTLMYCIGPSGRDKAQSSDKLALGLKDEDMKEEVLQAYRSVESLVFHYWKNETAAIVRLKKPVCVVVPDEVPDGFSKYLDKNGASAYLLLDYDPSECHPLTGHDILKIQHQGTRRYLPFVTDLRDCAL